MQRNGVIPWREASPWSWAIVLTLALALYAVGYDQGELLAPVLGDLSAAKNYLHELFHDGRHLLGFACH